MSACSRCGAPIRWVVTEAGKAMPLDVAPDPDGNVEMTGRMGRTDRGMTSPEVRVVGAQMSLVDLGERYVAHFATCPYADEFRKVDPDEVGGAPARAEQPATAHQAAVKVRRGTQQAAVLMDLREAPTGRTAYELAMLDTHLARVRPGITPNQAATRVDELRKKGLVDRLRDEHGAVVKRRAAASDAEVHDLTPRGRVEASRLIAAERDH